MTPQQFAHGCVGLLSGKVRSVVLYGSSVAGDFDEQFSDRNLLVIADRLAVGDLDALAPLAREWAAMGNRPPLLFTVDEAATAADTFPLEISDIQQAHELLAGQPLPDWRVSAGDLRLQLEREFKEKLLRLRERYMLAAGHPVRVVGLLVDSLDSFLVLARGALRLFRFGGDVPTKKLDALTALVEHVAFDAAVFRQVDAIKRQRLAARDVPAAELFAAYLRAIETIEQAVNDSSTLHAQQAQHPPGDSP